MNLLNNGVRSHSLNISAPENIAQFYLFILFKEEFLILIRSNGFANCLVLNNFVVEEVSFEKKSINTN